MAAARVSPAFREGAPVARRRRQAAPPPSSWLRRTWAKDAGPLCSWSKASQAESLDIYGPYEGFIAKQAVKVSIALERAKPALVKESLALLTKELEAIIGAVPPQRLPQLKRVVFWLDERVP